MYVAMLGTITNSLGRSFFNRAIWDTGTVEVMCSSPLA